MPVGEMMLALLGIGTPAQGSVAPPPPPAPKIECDPFLILFDVGSAKVPPRYEQMIDNIVFAWKHTKPHTLKIVGFTDPSGSTAYNLRLSRLRAQAVKAALVAKGLPARLITVEGLGERLPLLDTEHGSAGALNRRASVCFY